MNERARAWRFGLVRMAAPGLLLLGALCAAAALAAQLVLAALAGDALPGELAAEAAAWVFWLCVLGGAGYLAGSALLRPWRAGVALEAVPAGLRVGLRSRTAMLFLAAAAAGTAAVVWIDGRQAEALAPGAASMLAKGGALISLVGLLFALGVGVLSGRSLRAEALGLSRRLEALARGGDGPAIGRLPVHSPHETGRVASAFNRLAARLEVELERLAGYAAQVARAERLRAKFLRNVSHELRTPLNSILGYSDLMLRGEGLGPRAGEALQVIRDEGERLLLLINDVLWLAQLEAGRALLQPGPVRLDGLVAAVQELGPDFRRLQIALRAPAGLEEVCADAPRLTRSLAAMLALGVGPRRTIEVEAEPGAARVRLRVRLGQPAPSEDEQASLFQGFGRQEDAAPGLHLGLALARRVARLHGGELLFRDAGGEGEVVLELPLPGEAPS